MSISLIALAASASLPLRPLFITICCRLSICSSALTCAFLLSTFLPSKIFWVPYIPYVFTLLHVLRLLLSDRLKMSLQQIWCDTWKEIHGAASSAYDATVRSVKALLQSSRAATSNGAPETSTSPYSSSPATAATLSMPVSPTIILAIEEKGTQSEGEERLGDLADALHQASD